MSSMNLDLQGLHGRRQYHEATEGPFGIEDTGELGGHSRVPGAPKSARGVGLGQGCRVDGWDASGYGNQGVGGGKQGREAASKWFSWPLGTVVVALWVPHASLRGLATPRQLVLSCPRKASPSTPWVLLWQAWLSAAHLCPER